jgi:outer membrane protein assembly factor BamA
MAHVPRITLFLLQVLLYSTLSLAQESKPRSAPANTDYALTEMRVATIKVVGSAYPQSSIIAALGIRPGSTVDSASLRAASDRLGANGLFTQMQYFFSGSSAGIDLTFKVTDNPQLVPVYFENLVWMSRSEIHSELRQRLPLFDGKVPMVGNFQEQVRAELQQMLEKRGIRATVSLNSQGELGKLPTRYLYAVDGIRVRTARVVFDGVAQLDPLVLHKAAEPMLRENYAESYVRGFAKESLLRLYLQRGFLKAQFGDPEFALTSADPAATIVELRLRVEEGAQYKLGSITWQGNSVPATELAKFITLAPGQPADMVKLKADMAKIREAYGTLGRLAVRIEPEPEFAEPDVVNFRMNINEGERYSMGLLQIRGLPQPVIARLASAWQMMPGMTYDASYAKRFLEGQATMDVLPPDTTWNFNTREIINDDSRLVDVTVEFSPRQ